MTALREVITVITQWRPVATTVVPDPQVHTCPATAPITGPAARCRREQARAIAREDTPRARELGIGRPDLAKDYDDGGLVDLGAAPAATIARICGLTKTEAQRVVAARGTTLTLDDLLVAADVPVSQWGMIRDRAILFPGPTA